jgi:prepilin-type N-terminal cleavage/methylation domain-containing protein
MRKRKKKKGLTLAELLVSMGLLSVVSLVTLQLYLSAQTEFLHSSGQMTLSQKVRTTSDRIAQYVKTACPPNPSVSSQSPFYHPSFATEPDTEMYECDFISSICFVPIGARAPGWEVTDQTSEAYIGDANARRFIYENDVALTAPVLRYPSLYRYRISWNPLPTANYTHKGRAGDRSFPARSVVLERLVFAESGDPDTPNSGDTTTFNGVPLRQFLPDTGTPVVGLRRVMITPQVHLLTFNAYSSNVVLMRLRLYNRDPDNLGRLVNGETMHRQGFGGSRLGTGTRLQYVEMVTALNLPNLTMK